MSFAQLLRKSSNSQGKAHSASVFFRRHGSATSATSASLRPFGVPCITLAGWKSMEKRLPVALRALARFRSAKVGRRASARGG